MLDLFAMCMLSAIDFIAVTKLLLECQISVMNIDLTCYHLFLCLTGKVLIIGGSIANFTNVAATFKVKHVKYIYLKHCSSHVSKHWSVSNMLLFSVFLNKQNLYLYPGNIFRQSKL